jgi:glucose/arabinose dehydrogenase
MSWLRWCSVLLLLLAEGPACAVELEPVTSGLTNPLYLTHARDASGRLFVVEQAGVVRVFAPGATTSTVFLDISDRVLSGGEQGLLGLTFHPQYPANGRFFVDYTRKPDGATVVAEYGRSTDPGVASRAERVLLVIAQPFANHNGGMVEFGPDGFLYIGMGDGGSGNDPGNRAQNVNELLGKILRIDVDRSGALPYGIPADNPFAGGPNGRGEIYALGLRNPFRFSFDRATGQLIVGDVGQSAWEEIDVVTRGANLGWRVFEGNHCTGNDPALCTSGAFTPAIAEYAHTGGRCAVAGGYAYRGSRGTFPPGTYVFGDFCTGEIFVLDGSRPTLLLNSGLNITSFGEDEAGELYVVGEGGSVHRLAASTSALVAAVLPSSRSVTIRTAATAFATVINPNDVTATGCGLSLATPIPGDFAYQTTDAATNAVTGSPNTPVDIPPFASQSFVFALTPAAAFASTDVALRFACANVEPAVVTPGLTTLLLSSSTSPVPDVIALAATIGNTGAVEVSGPVGIGTFAVATANVGAAGSITVSADTGIAALPLTLRVCQTDMVTGVCLSAPSPTVTLHLGTGATGSFGVFVTASGNIPFDPAANRIFVRFSEGSVTRGLTSVAVSAR